LEQDRVADSSQRAVGVLKDFHFRLFEAEILLIEADSELGVLTDRNQAVNEMLAERSAEVKELERDVKTQKDVCRKCLDAYRKIQEEQDEDDPEIALMEDFLRDEDNTPEILEAEIEATRHRIELLHEGNPQAIQQYQKRQQDIEQLTKKIENFEGDLEKLNDEVKSIREQWEPELDRLVAEISDAFAFNFGKINCNGEVSVYKDDEDFKQWAIQIKVRFR
jgi:chromosome segregation ATPase